MDRDPVWAHVEDTHPEIAAGFTAMRRQIGRLGPQLAGWKVGWNDLSAREALGVPTGVVGYLTAATTSHFDTWDIGGIDIPVAEVEIAVKVGGAIGPEATDDQILDHIVAVAPAIEVLDISTPDAATAIAANVWHCAAAIGQWQPPSALAGPLRAFSSKAGLERRRLDRYPMAVAQLPDTLRFVADAAAKLGFALEAGHVILCGNVAGNPIPVRHGDVVRVDMTGLGAIAVSFTSEQP